MSSKACMYAWTGSSVWYTSYMCTLNVRLRRVSAFQSSSARLRISLDQSCPQLAASIMRLCVRPALRSAMTASRVCVKYWAVVLLPNGSFAMFTMTKFSWPLIAARMSALVQYVTAFEMFTAVDCSLQPVESCTSSTAIIRRSLHHWMSWLTCVPLTRGHWPPVDNTMRTEFAPVAAMAARSCCVGRDWNQVYG